MSSEDALRVAVSFYHEWLRPDAEGDIRVMECSVCAALVQDTQAHEAWHATRSDAEPPLDGAS